MILYSELSWSPLIWNDSSTRVPVLHIHRLFWRMPVNITILENIQRVITDTTPIYSTVWKNFNNFSKTAFVFVMFMFIYFLGLHYTLWANLLITTPTWTHKTHKPLRKYCIYFTEPQHSPLNLLIVDRSGAPEGARGVGGCHMYLCTQVVSHRRL